MLENSSSWSSFFRGYWCGNGKISTGHEKEKPARLTSSRSNNSGANKPFSPQESSPTLAESNLHAFTFVEIKMVTRNYSNSNFIGTGEFGPVYKGFIPDKLRPGLEGQHVAVKYLVRDGCQGPGHREWLSEIVYLGQLRHPNLVKLIGYCCEEDHRMLVYEYMPCGNLENHLFRSVLDSLTWSQRIKIAVHAAKGLAFLHEAEKPIIYLDFKASNILLDSDYKAKLSDFGLAKEGPPEYGCRPRSTRILGTHGYTSPEYIMTDQLTAKSNVYSFGVVLLEILTGRRAVDKQRRPREQNLAEWARPFLKKPNKLHRIMDSNIEYSRKAAQKAAFVAYECLSRQPEKRPGMRDVVNALEPLLVIVDPPIV